MSGTLQLDAYLPEHIRSQMEQTFYARVNAQAAFEHAIHDPDFLGAPTTFVYIPLGEGLTIIPLGGYQPFVVRAWMPVGNTGAIRGAVRNATVVADQDITLLMVPREVYLRQWHHPYSTAELMQLLAPA